MKEIQLSFNKVALVDDDDYQYLNQFKWYAWKYKTGKFYAARYTIGSKINLLIGKRKIIYMHRVIMNVGKGEKVDHRNKNGLDNQKHNLRIATSQQNCMNREKHPDNISGYKGVAYFKKKKVNKWQARIGFNGKSLHLGYFSDPIEAAKAYDKKAFELHGEFATLNFSL